MVMFQAKAAHKSNVSIQNVKNDNLSMDCLNSFCVCANYIHTKHDKIMTQNMQLSILLSSH